MAPVSKAPTHLCRYLRRDLSPIPDLDINNFIRFQRLADGEPQQGI
jgi:hypothetical protein